MKFDKERGVIWAHGHAIKKFGDRYDWHWKILQYPKLKFYTFQDARHYAKKYVNSLGIKTARGKFLDGKFYPDVETKRGWWIKFNKNIIKKGELDERKKDD